MERVQDVRYVQHHLWVRQVERDGDHGAQEQPRVLPERRQRARVQGVVQGLQPPLQRLPLFNRQLRIRRLLAQQVAETARGVVVAQLEPPVTLGRPHADAVVSSRRHRLVQGVEHHSQRVPRRPVQTLPDGRPDLEPPQPAVLVPVVEHVAAPAGEVVRLEELDAVAVPGEERGGGEAADAAADDDDVVLLVGVLGGDAGFGRGDGRWVVRCGGGARAGRRASRG
mmetsp:Transcript_9476/g.38413  ORF Transcript_9476/g.38413 Transcript_9476/m.38413 type:complete len:225 (-) Transcript_9476:368-1042(-)